MKLSRFFLITYRDSVFLSPRIMEHRKNISSYLTHELSHLLLLQHMGLYKFVTSPPWFTEGLATYVSEGGGAGNVSEKEAVASILSGKAFEPDTAGGFVDFFIRKYGNHWNLDEHMFYRQASLFVEFMKQYNSSDFRKMLVGMERRRGFDMAFRQAYNTSMLELWQLFISQLKSETECVRSEDRNCEKETAVSLQINQNRRQAGNR